MALFTDGLVSGLEDLTAQDTQLGSVANVEGIDVTQKLRLAQDELALELGSMLDSSGSAEQVLWRGGVPGIESVVITPALKLWHTYRALEMVYRDAYSNQLNDRYRAKRDQFAERAKWAVEKLMQAGIGIASRPMPRASAPTVTGTPGSLPDGTYYVATSWTSSDGEEGASSTAVTIACEASTLVAQQAKAPATAVGWNVYVGPGPELMTRQNAAPIAIGQTWMQANSLTSDGTSPGPGQAVSYYKATPRMMWRG